MIQPKSLIGFLALLGEISHPNQQRLRDVFYKRRKSIEETFDEKREPDTYLLLEDLNEDIHQKVLEITKPEGVHGIVCFECLDMCSSRLGERKALIFGPDCTYQTLDQVLWYDKAKKIHNKLDTELASTQKFPVAYWVKPEFQEVVFPPDGQVENDHISASFGDRKPPYSNWHYISLVFITREGHHAEVARHAHTISSVAARVEAGHRKVGNAVGFGEFKDEIVVSYKVSEHQYRRHPDGIVVRFKPDAYELLVKKLRAGRSSHASFTREEHQSLDFVREMGRVWKRFDVVADDCVPQMTPKQFWNTMPDKELNAPGGFFLPRGLCDVVNVDTDVPSVRE
jgi:hypothetical protein